MSTNSIVSANVTNHYYSLPNRQKTTSASHTKKIQAAIINDDFGELLDGLSASVSNENTSFKVRDSLDLSPAAQRYLDFYTSSAGGLVANEIDNSSGFVLSDSEVKKITSIITAYKDAPFTASTYSRILRDLGRAGLSPAQLSAREASNPLTLSQLFRRALGEQDRSDFVTLGTRTDRANEAAYISQIFSEWQRVSNTSNPMIVATFIENPYAYSRRKYHE